MQVKFSEKRNVYVPIVPVLSFEEKEYEEFVHEQIVENDRVVKRSKLMKVRPSERMRDYNVSDFYLENLIASGYDLKSTVPLDASRFKAVDAAVNVAKKLTSNND